MAPGYLGLKTGQQVGDMLCSEWLWPSVSHCINLPLAKDYKLQQFLSTKNYYSCKINRKK